MKLSEITFPARRATHSHGDRYLSVMRCRRSESRCRCQAFVQPRQLITNAGSIVSIANQKRVALALRNLGPFGGLNEKEIAALLEAGHAWEALPGQVINAKDKPVDGLTLLLDGEVFRLHGIIFRAAS